MSAFGSIQRTRSLLLDVRRPAWRDAEVVSFQLSVDRRLVQDLLPPGLVAEPAATLFVADYPDTSFGIAYRECGVLLHAKRFRRPVLHCAWMVVDDDSALILGRELLGFPKKLARIDCTFDVARGEVKAQVERRGVTLLSLSARGVRTGLVSAPFPRSIVNVRGIPGLLPSTLLRMDVPQVVHEGACVELDVTLRGGAHDPLDALVGSRPFVVDGEVVRCDIGVPPKDPGPIPRGIFPVGLTSPTWLLERLPMRSL